MLELTESIGKNFSCDQLWRYSHDISYLVHSLLEPVTIGLICTFVRWLLLSTMFFCILGALGDFVWC